MSIGKAYIYLEPKPYIDFGAPAERFNQCVATIN